MVNIEIIMAKGKIRMKVKWVDDEGFERFAFINVKSRKNWKSIKSKIKKELGIDPSEQEAFDCKVV